MERTLWLNRYDAGREPNAKLSALHMKMHHVFHKAVRWLDRNSKHLGYQAPMHKSSWRPFLALYCHTSYSGQLYLWFGVAHHDWLLTVTVDWAAGWGEYIRLSDSHRIWGVYADVWRRLDRQRRNELRAERRD